MNLYEYTIDVSKLGRGDAWEIADALLQYDPDELSFDFINEDILFNVHCDQLDKIAIEEFLGGYADLKFDCEGYGD